MDLEKLTTIIHRLLAESDKTGSEIDPDELLAQITAKYPASLAAEGGRLVRGACRRLIVTELRRMSAMNPDEDDGPQLAIPGLERIPTHVMFQNGSGKIVGKHVLAATVAQHKGCLTLKRLNTQRCIDREGQQERVIDLLESTGYETLGDWWRDRFANEAA